MTPDELQRILRAENAYQRIDNGGSAYTVVILIVLLIALIFYAS